MLGEGQFPCLRFRHQKHEFQEGATSNAFGYGWAMCCAPRSRTRARCSWVRGWNRTCRRRRCRAGTAGGGRTTGPGLPGMPGGHPICPCASCAPCFEVAAGLGGTGHTTHHPPTVPAITIEARPRRRWTWIRWHHKIPVGEFRPLNDVAAHCAHPSWLPWSRHLRGQGKEGGREVHLMISNTRWWHGRV